MEKILKDIVDKRKITIKEKGITFGINIPEKRVVPLSLPDFEKGVAICEIKRGSPSEGLMNNIKDPVSWAGDYVEAGANAISILTEEDFFYGSLQNLIDVKTAYPSMTILRKDFLLSPEEIEISYRAGADMVLLIVSVLVDLTAKDLTLIKSMKDKAESLGMLPLIEVHNKEELDAILPLNPKLIGINSRDLKTFKINRGYPVGLRNLFPEGSYSVFESGIRNSTDSFFVGSSGFNAILVGSSIIKSGNIKEKISDLKSGFSTGMKNRNDFYTKIFYKMFVQQKTVVKICGITNIEDAKLAVEAGADAIGFIFAKSPRQVDFETAKQIAGVIGDRALKVGVVVNDAIEEVVKAVRDGWLDAVQFHGDIDNDTAASYNVCWYKAVRAATAEDFYLPYFSPLILFDAFSKEAYGGTGKQIDKELLDYAMSKDIPLNLAGGINPDNVNHILETYKPLMVDVSSGLEAKPGKKDPDKIKKFFDIINVNNVK